MVVFVLAVAVVRNVRTRRTKSFARAEVVHSDRVPTKAVQSEHSQRAAGRRIAATAAAVCVGVGLGVELARAACDCGRRVDSHLAEGHGQKACGAHRTESHESRERLFVVVAQKPSRTF